MYIALALPVEEAPYSTYVAPVLATSETMMSLQLPEVQPGKFFDHPHRVCKRIATVPVP